MKRCRRAWLATAGLSMGLALAQSPEAPGDKVVTGFTILVGYPSSEAGASAGALLVPGTVIPLATENPESKADSRSERVAKSLSFRKTVEKLWETFRLDPNRQTPQGIRRLAAIGKTIALQSPVGANLQLAATLLGYNDKMATYRIVFKQGEKSLADSPVSVLRGGRAVVGGMDGDAAPYIFLFIEPELPLAEKKGMAFDDKGMGVSTPVLIHKVNPKYPESAKQEKVQGEVILELFIDEEGRPFDLEALESPDPRLSEAAVEAVRQWIFQPARNDKGEPLKVRLTINLKFALK